MIVFPWNMADDKANTQTSVHVFPCISCFCYLCVAPYFFFFRASFSDCLVVHAVGAYRVLRRRVFQGTSGAPGGCQSSGAASARPRGLRAAQAPHRQRCTPQPAGVPTKTRRRRAVQRQRATLTNGLPRPHAQHPSCAQVVIMWCAFIGAKFAAGGSEVVMAMVKLRGVGVISLQLMRIHINAGRRWFRENTHQPGKP